VDCWRLGVVARQWRRDGNREDAESAKAAIHREGSRNLGIEGSRAGCHAQARVAGAGMPPTVASVPPTIASHLVSFTGGHARAYSLGMAPTAVYTQRRAPLLASDSEKPRPAGPALPRRPLTACSSPPHKYKFYRYPKRHLVR